MDYLQKEKARLLSEKEYKTDTGLFDASSIRKLSIEDLDDVLNFDSIQHFQDYLRDFEELPDCVMVNFELYSLESYDMEGKEAFYASIDANKRLSINTTSRYEKNGFSDLTVEEDEGLGYTQKGISYSSIKHLSAGWLEETYKVNFIANVTIDVKIKAKSIDEAISIANNMQHEEILKAGTINIYSIEEVLKDDVHVAAETEIDNKYILPLQEGKISVFGFEDIKGKYFEVVFDKEEAGLKLHPTGEYVSVSDLERRIDKVVMVDGVEQYMISEMITTAHNKDSYTVEFSTFDGGEALLDIDFANGKGVEILTQINTSTKNTLDFIEKFEEMTGIVDWLKEHSTKYIEKDDISPDVAAMSDEQRKSAMDEIEAKSDRNIDLT